MNKGTCKIGTDYILFYVTTLLISIVRTKCTLVKARVHFFGTTILTSCNVWYDKRQWKSITALQSAVHCHELWYGATRTRFLVLIPLHRHNNDILFKISVYFWTNILDKLLTLSVIVTKMSCFPLSFSCACVERN